MLQLYGIPASRHIFIPLGVKLLFIVCETGTVNVLLLAETVIVSLILKLSIPTTYKEFIKIFCVIVNLPIKPLQSHTRWCMLFSGIQSRSRIQCSSRYHIPRW